VNAAVPPAQSTALRKYAAAFASQRPPIFDFFPGGSRASFPFGIDSDRGLGILLLFAALYRPGQEVRAAEIVGGLFKSLGLEVFKMNRIPVARVRVALDGGQFSDPEEQQRVPGILRSVCDFFFHTGSLGKWLSAATDWEDCAKEISERIFWMGKRSRLRTKARYFLWLTTFLENFRNRFPVARDFAWPVLEGHARLFHLVLRPRAKAAWSSPEGKLKWFSQCGREIFPQEPWRLFQPLKSYLYPVSEREYLCRKVQGGCRPCPLASLCPASKHLIAAEKRWT